MVIIMNSDLINIIGYWAAGLTTISFLPQVVQAWKHKKTGDISLSMYIIFIIGISLWLIYGIIKNDMPIILANIVTLILASVVLILKLKYK